MWGQSQENIPGASSTRGPSEQEGLTAITPSLALEAPEREERTPGYARHFGVVGVLRMGHRRSRALPGTAPGVRAGDVVSGLLGLRLWGFTEAAPLSTRFKQGTWPAQ